MLEEITNRRWHEDVWIETRDDHDDILAAEYGYQGYLFPNEECYICDQPIGHEPGRFWQLGKFFYHYACADEEELYVDALMGNGRSSRDYFYGEQGRNEDGSI